MRIHEYVKRLVSALFLIGWSLYFSFLWRDLVFFDRTDLRVGGVNLWGDWAMHFTLGAAFAYRSPWITSHPLLTGAPFAYPFLVNWISGMLVRMGVEFFSAFVIPSYVYSLLFVFVVFLFFHRLFSSRAVAMVSTSIFLLNGGLGFWWYIQDVLAKPTLQTLFGFTTEYTHMPKIGIEWISIITSMILPQRSFVFGFPIALGILLLLFQQIKQRRTHWKRWVFALLGLLYGLMPIIHTHSSFMIALVLVGWGAWSVFRKEPKKDTRGGYIRAIQCWLVFAFVAGMIALPFVKTFFSHTVSQATSGGFIRWYPGWFVHPEAEDAGVNWVWWWMLNWGLTLPLGIYGWFKVDRTRKIIFAPFLFIFVLLNLFLFQPFVWDNTKLLVWASLGVSGLAGAVVVQFIKRNMFTRVLAIALFFLMIFSGSLDAYAAIDKRRHNWSMYRVDDLALADEIRRNTNVNAVFLTSDTHNNPINLAGRQLIMGFRGWLWTYGFNYWPIEMDVMTMYGGGPRTEELLKKYTISYVVFDEKVLREYKGNEKYYINKFPVALKNSTYRIYRVQ